jgi:hypothetical protein
MSAFHLRAAALPAAEPEIPGAPLPLASAVQQTDRVAA